MSQSLLTYEDIIAIPELEYRELIDGELFVSAARHWQHQDAVAELAVCFLQLTRLLRGKLLIGPVDVVLSHHTVLQPDILFVAPNNFRLLSNRGEIDGAPDIVVEIVSPETREMDYLRKPNLYARAGVPEYWLVDPAQRQIIVHSLHAGRYVVNTPNTDNSVSSRILAGLTINPIEFFRDLLG